MGAIGIEWVRKYHGLASDLSNTKAQAEGFTTRSAPRACSLG
jgi:hypothetical protein